MKHHILVVDDESSIREFLSLLLEKEGYHVMCAEDGAEAKQLLDKNNFHMIISDLQMPKVSGMELLQYAKAQRPDIVFLMVTAFANTETAVEAMKLGAYDYIQKPFKIDEVRINIAQALRSQSLESENRQLKQELVRENVFQNMVGVSQAMQDVFSMVQRLSQTPSNILITGESGTGKEMIAKSIHYNGPLKDKAFVPVNCGAIPESLMESEIFGHKKGSFTGAVADKRGLFEAADGGTLFLDELGELPLNMQVKLLRAVQDKLIRRLGAVDDIEVNVRIIAATNCDLPEMIKEKKFRQDLYYRLNVINIQAPPLRGRREDVPVLAKHFLKKYNQQLGRSIQSISKEALERLKLYNYPGNVRELENIIERTVALEAGNCILPESLPPLVSTSQGPKWLVGGDIDVPPEGLDLERLIGEIEKTILVKAIHLSGGVKKRAAKLLNISGRSMRYRAAKHGLGGDTDDGADADDIDAEDEAAS